MARVGRPPSCTCGNCKKCEKAAYMREWWAKWTPEQKRAKRVQRDPERVRREDARKMRKRRATRPEYRLRERARAATRKLKRQPCEVCGAEQVHAHHDDYYKPLEVRWLCRKHHEELHTEVPSI